MRRFLLLTIAAMMTISMMAIGAGNGKNKANAIDFNWADGHTHEAGSALWYRVPLSQLSKEANDPTLALYLTNLTTDLSNVSLSVDAEVMGQKASKNSSYKIAGKGYEIWSLRTVTAAGKDWTLKELMSLGLNEVYVKLEADKQIKLTAKAYKTEDIVDDACKNAVDFNWNGETVKAGEKWFMLNLSEVKNSDKQLKFVVTNKGAAPAKVAFDMSLDCPASAVIEKDWVIAAGAQQEDEFGRVFLDVLKEDYVFLKLTTNQPLTLAVEEVVVLPPPPGKYDSFVCDAPMLKFDEELNLTAGEHVYKVLREDLIAARDYAYDFHVINNNSTAAKLTVETAFACPVKSAVEQVLTVEAQEEIAVGIKGNVLASVASEWVYIRMTAEQDLTAYIGVRNTNPCANAVPFDWTTGASLKAGESQWYEMDITSLKQNKQHLKLNLVNHSSERAIVSLEMALDCGGTILPLTLPIPAGLDISQVIDYQIIARSPLNKIYLSVSTNAHIELAAGVKNYIAADQTPCLNSVEVERGVEYEHKPGTKWYDVSLDLLWSKADYSSIYLANKGNKTAHVTIGAVTSCQYTTGTTITLPIPAGLELGALAPNVLGKLIEELVQFEKASNKVEAANVYLEITTDQPLAFGLDVINKTTSPCLREDLVTFDWNKGAKIQAGTPVWYDVDLTTVKNTGKHVKLTFTNHTDSLVWAATIVSVDCPAKLTMPLVLPVPAGMSIDKFIDYHYFAVPNVDNIYVGVVTDGALEMAATTYNAVIAPSADCLSAVEVTSDFKYTQKAGSQWYKFPMGLFNDGGHAGKISLRNLGSETATLTAGMTVGCEYAIPTYGKVKMPRELAFSLAVPTSVLAKARKLIDADITEFYMQLTSDQDIVVALDMDASSLKACYAAVPFDWNNWEKNGLQLQANQDVWYEVNLRYPWEKIKKGEDLVFSITNNNNVSVDFEAALSPTCPVFFALESYATIPANVTVQQTLEFSKLAEFLKQYDRELYNDETALILEKYNAYVVLNKIDAKLGKYGKYFPVSKLEEILDQYGKYIAYAELKNLIDNREKYLSKSEIKSRLEEAKELLEDKVQEKLSIDQAIQLIDKLDAYIPYVDAETILKNYDQFIPYAGGAVTLLKKCEKYIPTDEIKQFVVKAKNAIPMDQIRALFDKIEARLPRDLNAYMYIKTTGDIIVEPDTIEPTPEGCEDAIEYIWGTDIKVNEEAWYKVSIADVRDKDCNITLTVTNNSSDSVYADLSLFESCDADQAFMTLKNVGIAPNTTRSKTISSSELPGDIDVLYLYVQPKGEITINLSTDCPVFKYEYATVTSYACDTKVLTWNDTVHVNKYLDSVYTYVVTPLVAPISMTSAILDTISGATLVLTAGMTPDMNASAAAIKAYYQSLDNETIADVVSVVWATSVPVCGASVHPMTLTIEDECGNSQTLDYTFQVSSPVLVDSTASLTICASKLPYTWDGIVCEQAGVYYDTIPNIYGCDSVQVIYTLDVYPDITQTVIDTTICSGDSYTWNLSQKTYSETIKDTVVTSSVLTGCDSVVVLDLKVLAEMYHIYDTARICYGESYDWVVDGTTTNLSRPRDYSKKVSYRNYECDSVEYHLHLIVSDAPVVNPTEYVTIDLGQTYPWVVDNKVITCDTAGKYTYTAQNAWGCDSLVYTLEVTINDIETEEHKTITDLVCDGTEYVDPITGEKHIISSLIASTQTWKDTVVASPILDSIYTFIITPIVAPEEMSTAGLTAIAAVPTLTQGALPNVTGTIEAIKAYYQSKDDETIADVDSIYWSEASLNTAVACGATTHTMTLVVEAGCDNKITTTHAFAVAPIVGVADTITTCDSYFWIDSTYTTSGDHVYTTTASNGCDSVMTLHLTINTPVAYDTTVVACESYFWIDSTYTTSGDHVYTTTAANGCDSVMTLHLTINTPVAYDTTVVACESYFWIDSTYTTSGDHVYTTTAANGCDSVMTLHLTINTPVAYDTTVVACESYFWIDSTYTTSGDHVYTTTAANGCDSVMTLHLTINTPVAYDTTVVACESYFWIDSTYTTSGDHVYTTTAANGCDSVMTLHLTINTPVAYDTTVVACDSYFWIDSTYTTSGDHVYTTTAANGCDSVMTLHLTINTPVAYDTTVVACESYFWIDSTYTTSGDHVYTTTAANGCDSVMTLHLTINTPVAYDTTVVACESYFWIDSTYTTSGDHVYTTTAANGCDSVMTLHLTINTPVSYDTTVVACESYFWIDSTYTTSGDHVYTTTASNGCDSVMTLHLTINTPIATPFVELDTICVADTYIWHGQTVDATELSYYDTIRYVGSSCDSAYYELHLSVYNVTLPTITENDIIAICGNAIDVTTADSIILAHIASDPLYAAVTAVVWEVNMDGTWKLLTTDAIDGTIANVTLRYTVQTACEDMTSSEITVVVETPTPENDEEMADIPAYNKYGDRLLTIDLKYIEEYFGWTVAEEDVTWYMVVEDAEDKVVGTGYYLTTEDGTSLPAGYYYARVNHERVSPSDCDGILQTVILLVGETQVGLKLAPSVAKPQELIRLLNLDPETVSTVRMYSATGELMDTFQVTDTKETIFSAAQTAGYYIVEVQTETEKVSLRYIVK